MTTPITLRIISTELEELDVLVLRVPLSPFLPLIVSLFSLSQRTCYFGSLLTVSLDAKQARDLVGVLQEAKQQIDPRLAEMARYGGGGGGGRYGGYRGRGGGGYRGGK